jgi:hypothetical protein
MLCLDFARFAQADEFSGRANTNVVASAAGPEVFDVSRDQGIGVPSNRDFQEWQVTFVGQHDHELSAHDHFSTQLDKVEEGVNVPGVESKSRTPQYHPVFTKDAVIVKHGHVLRQHRIDNAPGRPVRADYA